jgi:hypothetical protein
MFYMPIYLKVEGRKRQVKTLVLVFSRSQGVIKTKDGQDDRPLFVTNYFY